MKSGITILLLFIAVLVSAQNETESILRHSKFYVRSGSDSAGLIAEYFNNKTLSGQPLISRFEKNVLKKWSKAPDVAGLLRTNFSVRWTGVIRCDSTGDYTLDVAGDDGYRLLIDNTTIIDGWKDQGLTEIKQTIHFEKNKEYKVKLEYYQSGGGAEIYFAYYPANMFFTFVPKVSWANTERYEMDNKELGLPKPGEKRVVFMGNSITEGWEFQRPNFFSKNRYINRGISGQTSSQMLVRFRPDVIDLKPAVVVILAGTNDIAGNNGPIPLDKIAGNIISMAELAKANQIKVVICSVLPAIEYPWNQSIKPVEKILALNKMLKAYADKNGLLYVDYYSHMVDEQKGLKKEYCADPVHPNEAGYIAMEPLVQDAINKTLLKK